MLLPKKIDQNRRNILIAVLVVIMLVIGYLLYTNFFAGSLAFLIPSQPVGEGMEIADFSAPPVDASFATDFIGQEPYKDLKDSSVPVVVDRMGRLDPFAAITFTGGAKQ